MFDWVNISISFQDTLIFTFVTFEENIYYCFDFSFDKIMCSSYSEEFFENSFLQHYDESQSLTEITSMTIKQKMCYEDSRVKIL